VISWLQGCLLCCVAVAAGVVPDAEGAEALSGDGALAAALDEVGRLRAENAELRVSLAEVLARDAERDAEMEKLRADFAVLQRMLFGRSSEKSRPEPPAGDGGGDAAGDGSQRGGDRGSGKGVKHGPGARAGRRDYSHLPRFEVFWDFPGGGYCCPECGEPFTLLGDHWSGEQLDWQVIVRLVAHCRRRYRRACSCQVPATVMAPGPPKAIGKGLFTNAFTAMLLTERYAAGRSMNSLVTGLERQGADISPATLAGTCAQAGALLAPLADAVTERSRGSWHLHADETTWRVFAPRDGNGPAKWWLWVFIGPDTVAFVMDPSRSGQVLARHAGIDEKTGQLTADEDGGPRSLVISSDFYAVYSSAGKKADGLVNLYCWAQYAEPGIMRNGAARGGRVACRGGARADAGAGMFCIITGSRGRRGRGQAVGTVRALCWAGWSARVPVLSAKGLRGGRSGLFAGPRGPAIVRWWPGQPRCAAGSSRRCGEGYERRFSWQRARGSLLLPSARA
jgi:transposase